MNEAVLRSIEAHALTPEAVESVIALSECEDVQDGQATLAREAADVTKRIGRLVAAIETGGDAVSLVKKLRELETRQKAIQVEAANLHPIPRLKPAVIKSRLEEWRGLLRSSTTQARTVLQRVLRGRLTFTPWEDGEGYDFEGPTRFDKLFTGVAVNVASLNKPSPKSFMREGDRTGALNNENDADYGRLLDSVMGKKNGAPGRN